MKLIKVTPDEKRLAKLANFKKKAPKKPKMSSGMAVKERFIARYNDWAKQVKSAAKEGRKIQATNNAIRNA